MQSLVASGVQLIGYVKTKVAHESSPGVWDQTGFRSMSNITTDLDTWAAHYSGLMSGIFADEVSNRWQAVENAAWGNRSVLQGHLRRSALA